METPSSTRRVTRSQTLAATNNGNNVSTLRKLEQSEKELTETRQRTAKQQDRSALFDITNDSPIVGLAMGILETPSSAMSKKKVISRGKHKHESTPGSGEALLRGQVKTLLQKVEEEAELSKLSSEHGPFLPLKGLVNSPMGLIIAPTPANTPQVLSLSAQSKELGSPAESPVEDKFLISQMISDIVEGKKQEEEGDSECDKNLIVTRSLLLDFSEKSEESFSSVVTYQGTQSEDKKEKTSAEDDDASIWSIQVNASTRDEQEEEGLEEECDENDDEFYYDHYDDGEEEEVGESELVDELCEGISKIDVAAEEKPTTTMAKFTGKHTRFCYNSDDEIDGEEEVCDNETESGGGGCGDALRLKGLPTPIGKHLRFSEEEQNE